MDASLFPSLFLFQRKMKPVLESIRNIFSNNSYVTPTKKKNETKPSYHL